MTTVFMPVNITASVYRSSGVMRFSSRKAVTNEQSLNDCCHFQANTTLISGKLTKAGIPFSPNLPILHPLKMSVNQRFSEGSKWDIGLKLVNGKFCVMDMTLTGTPQRGDMSPNCTMDNEER